MGTRTTKMTSPEPETQPTYDSIKNFVFHEQFPLDSNNGSYFNDVYLPDEILTLILSHCDAKEMLKYTLVCKKWCNIIKSFMMWSMRYERTYRKKANILPWYVYYCLFSTNNFDKNLVRNGNGEEKFSHWTICRNGGDGFVIEKPPCGCDPLPKDVPELNNTESCFSTSFYECNKLQQIKLAKPKLSLYILNKFKPHIYASEWVAGRFDCGGEYRLKCILAGPDYNFKRTQSSEIGYDDYWDSEEESYIEAIAEVEESVKFLANERLQWQKVELTVMEYREGVTTIIFQHAGKDNQFWKGHYGAKMAGGVLRILFNTMKLHEVS